MNTRYTSGVAAELPSATREHLKVVNRYSKRAGGHAATRTQAGLLNRLWSHWQTLLKHVDAHIAEQVFTRLSTAALSLLAIELKGTKLITGVEVVDGKLVPLATA